MKQVLGAAAALAFLVACGDDNPTQPEYDPQLDPADFVPQVSNQFGGERIELIEVAEPFASFRAVLQVIVLAWPVRRQPPHHIAAFRILPGRIFPRPYRGAIAAWRRPPI